MGDHPKPLEGEILAERDLSALADPLQLELIRDQVPGRDAGTAMVLAARRGRGRPPGSLNKRNAKFRDQVLAMGQHPAMVLIRAANTPVDTLAAQLGCTLHEAGLFAMKAAAELLPYLEGKQPITIDLQQHHDVVLVMAGMAGVGGAELDAVAHEINQADEAGEAIDWDGMTVEGLSQSGEPEQDVSPGADRGGA